MIHIICVAFQRTTPLQTLINSFLVQTDSRWRLSIIHDGPAASDVMDIVNPFLKDDRIHYYQSPARYEKWGHPNRRMMLQFIETDPNDFILITNDDNYYVPSFVEFFLDAVNENTGIVYCDMIHSHNNYDILISEIKEGAIDIGNFIVRADVAKQTGFNSDNFGADGEYAEACLKTCQDKGLNTVKISKCLYIHN